MNGFLVLGSVMVTLALIAYSFCFISLARRRVLTVFAFRSMLLGLSLDVTATGLMILGSSRGLWTVHGLMGYSALALMALESLFLSRLDRGGRGGTPISRRFGIFSNVVFLWWVVVYVAGVVLAMGRVSH
jgi:hypothetical protein